MLMSLTLPKILSNIINFSMERWRSRPYLVNMEISLLEFFSLSFVCFTFVQSQDNYLRKDEELSITEILEKYGFPAEVHEVTTSDGYILTIFRVPHGKNGTKPNSKPILMMHGLFGCAENYVIAEMFGSSMSGYFADHGYDVWLGNSRGNMHSRRHVRLDPNKNKFWNFSYHEIGMYDMPAMIDYILNTTGKKKLYYIGHSQGGTVFYIMNSLKPEYQKKFVQASLLAPAGFMNNFGIPLGISLAKRVKSLEKMFRNAKLAELPPPWLNISSLAYGTCTETPMRMICEGFYNLVAGQPGDFNPVLLMQVMRFLPTVSIKQVLHFLQSINSGRFAMWDYGKKKNLEVYGAAEPKDYPIETIQVPVAFYYSLSDTLVSTKDVENMCSKLPKCTRLYLLPNPKWTHLDFIFSANLVKELNEPVITHMNTFEDDD